MKEYPSIPREFQEIPNAYIWSKIDGCSCRALYTKKNGWERFGSRHQMIDQTDPILGPAIPLFLSTIAEPIAKIFKDGRHQHAICFFEYWGAKSLGGIHEAGDKMFATLFDVALDKKGILPPKDFLKMFGSSNLEIANFIGQHNWTRGFVDKVWNGEIEGASFEGVVGKGGSDHSTLTFRKAKQKVWIDAIKARWNKDEAEKLINS